MEIWAIINNLFDKSKIKNKLDAYMAYPKTLEILRKKYGHLKFGAQFYERILLDKNLDEESFYLIFKHLFFNSTYEQIARHNKAPILILQQIQKNPDKYGETASRIAKEQLKNK